jgi:SMODS domain-containing protein
MGNTQPVFDEVLAELEPTPTQKEGVQRSHNHLRDLLQGGQIGKRIVDHYLTGSYARDTAIHPLDDVDIIFVIDPGHWEKPLLASHPPPAAVLETFERAIRYRYPDSSLRTQYRSIRLSLFRVDIDVVPAIADPRDPELIKVPDTGAGKWIPSAPKKHTQLATAVNKQRKGLFKPLVKLLKGWNSNLPEQPAQMKSFAVETMAVRLFSARDFSTLEEGAFLFWDLLAKIGGEQALSTWSGDHGIELGAWTPRVLDAAGTGSNTLGDVPRAKCKRFTGYARMSRDLLGQAIRARTQERTEELVRRALRLE